MSDQLKTSPNEQDTGSDKILNVSLEDVLTIVMKTPGIKIDRKVFLKKELEGLFPEKIINNAIATNPAQAGIYRETINNLAKQCINYETKKVSAISFAAGIPGGFAMAATIPADTAQYFGFILRIMQKLAYLYGFSEFELSEDNVSDATMNEVLLFLGVMFGVQEANAAVKIIAGVASKKAAKSLARKALTKGVVYPIVKKITKQIGFRMTSRFLQPAFQKLFLLLAALLLEHSHIQHLNQAQIDLRINSVNFQ